MGNIGMKVLFLVLLYDQFIECTRQVLMVTPPPSAEVLRRSRKAATTDIRDGGIIPIRNFFNQTSSTCSRVKQLHYVGDRTRNCTSLRKVPITGCQGVCFPQKALTGNDLQYEELLEKSKLKYKCEPDRTVRKKVRIFCADDKSLTLYRIRVVKTCKCVQLMNDPNSVFGIAKDSNDQIAKQSRLFREKVLNLRKVLRIR